MNYRLSISVILLAAFVLNAQQTNVSAFSEFERELRNERAGFAGNKERLSKFFDAERRRLGDTFEAELLGWLGEDPERHYWISSFVESESYLHGNKALPQLSLLIKQQGLALVREKKDDRSQRYALGLSVTAAVLSSELGFLKLASSHKTEAERLLLQRPELSTSFPGMSDADRRRYNEIASGVKSKNTIVEGDTNPPPKAPISGGILNGRSSNLVKPVYTPEAYKAGASGQVTVKIVIDENGRVIWARAEEGHPMLRRASEEAAWQTTFPVTKLSGQPVKVSGVLLYNFVP